MFPPPDPGPSPGSASLPAVPHNPRPAVLATTPSFSPPVATLDPIALLKALRRRWPLALGVGLLAAVVVGIAVFFVVPPAKYTARAMLHVNSVQPRILLHVGENHTEYGAYQRTQLALLKSRIVLNAALKQPEVVKLGIVANQVDPIEWL